MNTRGSWFGLWAIVAVGSSTAGCGSSDESRRIGDDSDAQVNRSTGGKQPGRTSDAPDGSATESGGRVGAGGTSSAGSSGTSNAGSSGTSNAGGGGASSTSTGGGSSAGGRGGGAAGEPSESGHDGGVVVATAPLLALGRQHSCAIRRDRSVVCWGRGDHGELGDGAFRDAPPLGAATPVVVSGLESVAELTAGQYHACALLSGGGGVSCWGAAFEGQLGDESLHPGAAGVAAPTPVDLQKVIHVAANGGDHTCALSSDRTVQCWGDNLFGQLGNDSTEDSAAPVGVKGLTDAVQIAAGTSQSCALLASGAVECWGYGGVDASAGRAIMNPTPVRITDLSGVTSVVVGNSFACGLLDSGHVKCWGEGDLGQLGDGNENDSNNTPVDVQGVSDVVQLSAGRNHGCALHRDGKLSCWGDGEFGQLGDGVFHNGFPTWAKTPTPATAFSDVVEVSCGGNHTCVRTSTNAVKCVGGGEHGQLGNGMFYEQQPFGSATAVEALSL